MANLKVSPSVLTLFEIFSINYKIADWTWANSEVIEPVASIQKQISMKPKDGIISF